MVADTSSLTSEHAKSVGFVHHNSCVVFFLQFNDGGKITKVALHAEDTVHDNQFNAVGLALLELLFKVFHVIVLEFQLGGKTQSASVHDTGVVTVVTDNIVISVNQLADNSAVYGESGGEAKRFIFAHKFCQLFFQLNMNIQCAVQKTASCTSASITLHSCNSGVNHSLVAGKAGVCV